MINLLILLITTCCFAFLICYLFLCINTWLKKVYKWHKLWTIAIIIMILIIIVFVSSLLVKYDPKLHSFLDKLYSSKETNSVVSIICSLITFYIVNMIFDSPN